MVDEFMSYLLGRYTNRDQAFYQPSKFAYIWGLYEQVSPTDIKSKWWYNYAGEDAPYRVVISVLLCLVIKFCLRITHQMGEGYW